MSLKKYAYTELKVQSVLFPSRDVCLLWFSKNKEKSLRPEEVLAMIFSEHENAWTVHVMHDMCLYMLQYVFIWFWDKSFEVLYIYINVRVAYMATVPFSEFYH